MGMMPSTPRRVTRHGPNLPAPISVWSAQASGGVTDSLEWQGALGAGGIRPWLRKVLAAVEANPDTPTTITLSHRTLRVE